MARLPKRLPEPTVIDQVLDTPDTTVLDLLDNLLNKGVMLNGDITLGVAGIDLIYLRLSTLLCAVDRIFGESDRQAAATRERRPRARRPSTLRRRT